MIVEKSKPHTDRVGDTERVRYHCTTCGRWTVGLTGPVDGIRLWGWCKKCGEVTEAIRMVDGPK